MGDKRQGCLVDSGAGWGGAAGLVCSVPWPSNHRERSYMHREPLICIYCLCGLPRPDLSIADGRFE